MLRRVRLLRAPRRLRSAGVPPIRPSFRGGSGEPLVLLHPAFTSWRLWQPLLSTLTEHRDVFAPTLPGCLGGPALPAGQFSVQDVVSLVEAMLDDAGIARADIVGNSLGGYVAMELARRGRARRVIGIAPTGMFDRREARALERLIRRKWALAHLPPAAVSAIASSARGRALALTGLISDGAAVPAALAAHLVEATRACDVPGFFAAVRGEDGTLPAIRDLHQITTPTLLLWGDRDPYVTRTQIERYLGGLPDALLVELPGSGHLPQLDIPERIAREILEFTTVRLGVD